MRAETTEAPAARVLFGRESDVAALADLIGTHRLVSIVGAGGVGKTVLAAAVVDQLRGAFNGLVRTVELVPLTDARQLMPALVTALGLSVGPARARDAVAKALAASPHLLLLDNCEHLLPDLADRVAELHDSVSHLRILATSQEPLNLKHERVYRLGPLELPTPDAALDTARKAGAVALLEDRARAADRNFSLDASNIEHAIDICRRLDGIPLAIELAAARVRTLGVGGLRNRLDDRLHLLAGGARNLPPRHRALRAALNWSWSLLSEGEQVVFRRLGVMSGAFDLEAAQAVASTGELDQWQVLDALGGLSDKSLVVTETRPGGEVRFHLLETMRHFALDRLVAAGEEPATRDRHVAYFLRMAEAASEGLAGPEQGQWLARLDLERDNLFAAQRACDVVPDGIERGLRLANALIRYSFNRGVLLQGQQLFEVALGRPGVERHATAYARGLMNYARIFAFRGLDREAAAQLALSIEAARQSGALAVQVEALSRLGYARLGLDDRQGARTALEEACELARSLDTGDQHPKAVAFSNRAELERLECHFDVAAPLYEECLAIHLAAGDRQATMISLNNLSMMALAVGELALTGERLRASLKICDELDSRRGRLVVMEVCAGLAAELGDWARSIRFEAGARRHTLEMGRRRDVVDEAFLAPRIERARKGCGASQCQVHEATAHALDYDAAVNEMRIWLEGPGSVPGSDDGARRATGTLLTTREQEIVSLIARGYNNPDVARLLQISVLTVRTHRQRLMDKLELRNAAEITAYAIRMGWYDPS